MKKAKKKKAPMSTEPPVEKIERGWAEVLPRFPDDILLRSKGFKVHSRPKDKPAVWQRSGVLFDEPDALEIALGEDCTPF